MASRFASLAPRAHAERELDRPGRELELPERSVARVPRVVEPPRELSRPATASSAAGLRRPAVLVGVAAVVTAFVARDVALTPAVFARLVTYRYSRAWPSAHALGPAFAALGAAAVGALLVMSLTRAARRGAVALVASALALASLLHDAYVVGLGRDGGQREILAAYYRDTRGRGGGRRTTPLVAYQLNWKGENFYTGGDLAIFVSSGEPLRTWIESRRRAGEHLVYFALERGRLSALRAEIARYGAVAELTGPSDSIEFTLARLTLHEGG